MQGKLSKALQYIKNHKRVSAHLALMLVLTNLIGILFGSIYGTQPYHDIPIVVVSHDDSATAESFVEFISENDTFAVTYGTEDALAEEMLFNGDAQAAVIIPEDFSENIMNGIESEVMVILDGAMSPATSQLRNTINSTLTSIRSGYLIKLAEGKFNMPPESAQRALFPFGMSTQILGNPVSNSAYMTVEGYLLTMIQVGCFCIGAVIYENKNIKKYLTSGAVIALTGTLTGISAIFVQNQFFDIPFLGSRFAGLLLIILLSIGCSFFGLAVNRLTKGHVEDKLFMSAAFSLTMVLSGYVYPIGAMPAAFEKISWFLPNTHIVIPFRDLALTGYTMGDIAGDILWMVGFAGLMVFLAIFSFRKRMSLKELESETDAGQRKKKAFSFRKGRAEK